MWLGYAIMKSTSIQKLLSAGNKALANRDFEKARDKFQKAAATADWSREALFGLADSYRGMRRYSEALEVWEQLVEVEPLNQTLLTRAGDTSRNLGELDKAEQYYRKSLQVGYDLYAKLGLSHIYKIRGDWPKTIGLLEELLQKEPFNPRILEETAFALVKAGNKRKAQEIIDEYLERGGMRSAIKNLLITLQSEFQ